MNDTVVLYHDNCLDGITAASICERYLGQDCTFIPVQYGQPAPNLRDKRVYIVDFSYPRQTLIELKERNKFLIVLDHHKTAEKELQGLDFCIFDLNKSGARITYEYFLVRQGHWLIDYTEDRDLWHWKLPNSKEVSAALQSYPMTLEQWRSFWPLPAPIFMIQEGEAILRYQQQIIAGAVKNAYEIEFDGHKVLTTNATTLISEIGNELCKDRPFSITWFERADGQRVYSLRSKDSGLDVSEIAKRHGGGGHRNAAGFTAFDPRIK